MTRAALGHATRQLPLPASDLDVFGHLILFGDHLLALLRTLLGGRIGEFDAVLLERAAGLGLRGCHVGAIGRDVLRPQIGHQFLLIGRKLVPEYLAQQRNVFGDELVVLQRILDAGIPQFPGNQTLVRTDQPVEGALRQRQRHVGPRCRVGDRAEKTRAPGLAGAAGVADLHALEVGQCRDRLVGRVPVLEAEIEIGSEHMRAQLLLDLRVEILAGLAVDDAMDQLHRLAVQHRKLEAIGVRNDASDGPAAGRGHLDLALDQRLADLEVGIKLAALE
jgi:hypothetical protein